MPDFSLISYSSSTADSQSMWDKQLVSGEEICDHRLVIQESPVGGQTAIRHNAQDSTVKVLSHLYTSECKGPRLPINVTISVRISLKIN